MDSSIIVKHRVIWGKINYQTKLSSLLWLTLWVFGILLSIILRQSNSSSIWWSVSVSTSCMRSWLPFPTSDTYVHAHIFCSSPFPVHLANILRHCHARQGTVYKWVNMSLLCVLVTWLMVVLVEVGYNCCWSTFSTSACLFFNQR